MLHISVYVSSCVLCDFEDNPNMVSEHRGIYVGEAYRTLAKRAEKQKADLCLFWFLFFFIFPILPKDVILENALNTQLEGLEMLHYFEMNIAMDLKNWFLLHIKLNIQFQEKFVT